MISGQHWRNLLCQQNYRTFEINKSSQLSTCIRQRSILILSQIYFVLRHCYNTIPAGSLGEVWCYTSKAVWNWHSILQYNCDALCSMIYIINRVAGTHTRVRDADFCHIFRSLLSSQPRCHFFLSLCSSNPCPTLLSG